VGTNVSSVTVDVAVIGGGPSGSATALRLARAGCDLRLVTAKPPAGPAEGQLLAAVGRHALDRLGIWEAFTALGFQPSYGSMTSWGGDEVSEGSSIFNPDGPDWMMRRHEFDAMLLAQAQAAGATACEGPVVAADPRDAHWNLDLRGGARLRAKVVIDATGRRAMLARRFGRREAVDHLVAVRYRMPKPPEGPTPAFTVESSPDGWWYTLPAPDGGLTVFEMTDVDLLRPELSPQRFGDTGLTARRAGGHRLTPSVGVQAAATVRHRVDARGLLAVGDAAVARDPLAADGLCFSLVSAREAADTALAMLGGESARQAAYVSGLDGVLQRYLQERDHMYGLEKRWRDRPFWQRRQRA
jgi:flavin-dependent dehydrogenase